MNTLDYLKRISYKGDLAPTDVTLRRLHRAHLLAIPFENLDIHLARPITLDLPSVYTKIVAKRRGGFCYELNVFLAWLLHEMGFQVTLLSASVARSAGDFGPEFDHLTLLVETCDSETETAGNRWLADIGFGDSFLNPLRIDDTTPQSEGGRAYRLVEKYPYHVLWQRDDDKRWSQQYRFTLQPRRYEDFAAMCHYHQTSPESGFTQKRLCTLARPDGRITLSEHRFIVTRAGVRQEELLDDEKAFQMTLHDEFGISLAPEPDRHS